MHACVWEGVWGEAMTDIVFPHLPRPVVGAGTKPLVLLSPKLSPIHAHAHSTHSHTVTYMHTLHLHSHTHVHTHTHHIHTLLMHHTYTCTHHTYMHVHMHTHKHSDTHCMSVPIATCIEWLCEMLKCTCVCEGGGGRIEPHNLHGGRAIKPPPPPPPHTHTQTFN